jgi:hypothetical protein
VSVASPQRLRRDLVDLLHRTSDMRAFSLRATRILARAVPFDGSCMLTFDPATLLPTGEIADNALPAQARPRMAQIEIGGDDVNTFRGLLRSGRGAASLIDCNRRRPGPQPPPPGAARAQRLRRRAALRAGERDHRMGRPHAPARCRP